MTFSDKRVIGEHEPVAQHVGREVADVRGGHVAAPAQQRQHAAACTSPIGPRGLAPYSIRCSSSGRPYCAGRRVASASATA